MPKELLLAQGEIAIVDDRDYERLLHRNWTARRRKNSWRIRAVIDGVEVSLSNFIIWDFMHTYDHKNGNPFDNRRDNLRIATVEQNNWNRGIQQNNTSGYKGISTNGRGWKAEINVSKHRIHLGTFDSARKAAIRYDMAAIKYFGEFARTNGRMGLFHLNSV